MKKVSNYMFKKIKENMSGSNKSMFLIIRNMGLWMPIKHMFNCTR